jgi:hypothetical protein
MVTTGQVHQITWSDSARNACHRVGSTPDDTEALFLIFGGSPSELASQRSILNLLSVAQREGLRISVFHDDTSGEITGVETEIADISPTGPAIRGDLFAVSGSGFPGDARVVFDSATVHVQLTPAMVRPHLVVVESLPPGVPLGPNTVQVIGSGGFASSVVPVTVHDGSPLTRRVLHSGPPLDATPYTIAFAAAPAYRQEWDGALIADPMITDHPLFCDLVAVCLASLFNSNEELLRYRAMDRSMRLVAIFDPSRGVSRATALVQELTGSGTLESRQDRLQAFVSDYGETADVAFAISSSNHATPSAWPTEDDDASPGQTYEFDDFTGSHRRVPRVPGSIAIPRALSSFGLLALHEFGHAASSFDYGFVADLYNDVWTSIETLGINRKWRAEVGDPVPTEFAVLDGKTYMSDPNRDGLGYPADWLSYHPALRSTLPNIMDLSRESATGEQSLFDEITEQWFRDRLLWKVDR